LCESIPICPEQALESQESKKGADQSGMSSGETVNPSFQQGQNGLATQELSLATEVPFVPNYGKSWFRRTCTDSRAHVFIDQIERLLRKGKKVQPEDVTDILGAVGSYSWDVEKVRCPWLCTQYITVVKRIAFLEAAEDIYRQLFGTLGKPWEIVLGIDWTKESACQNGSEANSANEENGHDEVSTVSMFLRGWIDDLKHVHQLALPAYMDLLRLLDVHYDAGFDQAVKEFVQYACTAMTVQDVAFAGKIAYHFIRDILNPLVALAKPNFEVALKHITAAAELIDFAVRLDPAAALRHENTPVIAAMRELNAHLNHLHNALRKQNRASKETYAILRTEAYGKARETMKKLWKDMASFDRSYMKGPYSELMSWLDKPMPQKDRNFVGTKSSASKKSARKLPKKPKGVYAPAQPQRRGPKERVTEADVLLIEDWEHVGGKAGTTRQDFCDRRGLTILEFEKIQSRVQKHRKRKGTAPSKKVPIVPANTPITRLTGRKATDVR